jgi:hypothetical protein
MSKPTARRRSLPLAIAAALTVAGLAGATQAQASTLYACVKKSGTARVFTKKPKCKKGESKISWNTSGPAGANGTNGKNGTNGSNGSNGTNGANGAVGGFSASGGEVTYTTATEGSPATVLSKALPAGNFIVTGKAELLLSDNKTGGEAGTTCKLIDIPSGGGTTTTDRSSWLTLINSPFIFVDLAQTTLPFNMAVSSPTRASTVSLVCYLTIKEAAGGVLTATANESQITAVQTTSNS